MSTVLAGAVGEFVTAVRAELDDLTPDEIEELTGGLEADVADALATEGDADPAQRFGAPAAYAAELRSAAGLAPRAVSGGGRRGVRNLVGDIHSRLRREPWWDPAIAYLVSLRPAWWLVRAALVDFALILAPGFGFAAFVVLLPVFVVLSVLAGRRRWAERGPAFRVVIAVLNTVCAAGLIIGSLSGISRTSAVTEPAPAPYDGASPFGTGLTTQEGYTVANIFPYDKDGKSLTDVQLFDDRGRPLNADQGYVDDQGRKVDYAPGVDETGQQRWNAYPLRERGPYDENAVDPVTGEPVPAPTGPPHDAARPDPSVAPLVALPSTSPEDGESSTSTPTASGD